MTGGILCWVVTHEKYGTVEVRARDRVGAIMAASIIWRVDWLALGLECKAYPLPPVGERRGQ